jgi:hypothetical protein
MNTSKKFYVHYTVMNNGAPQKLVAGPYSDDEAIDHRRDIASYVYVSNCFISEEATP